MGYYKLLGSAQCNSTGTNVTFTETLDHFAFCYIVGGYGASGNDAGSIFFPAGLKQNITIVNAASTSVHYYVQNFTSTGCKILGDASTHYVRIYGVGRISS